MQLLLHVVKYHKAHVQDLEPFIYYPQAVIGEIFNNAFKDSHKAELMPYFMKLYNSFFIKLGKKNLKA